MASEEDTKFTAARGEQSRRKMREMRRWNGGGGPCVVIRQSGGGAGGISMDTDEVRACRDLGLDLPQDWTVEIPSAAFSRNSPVFLSGAGNDAEEVKARLRVWAQAVALASASAGQLSV